LIILVVFIVVQFFCFINCTQIILYFLFEDFGKSYM
jgi:hypothetical protein